MGVTSVQFFREKTVFIWFDYSQNFFYSRKELYKILYPVLFVRQDTVLLPS
jgi:hypothetical protein